MYLVNNTKYKPRIRYSSSLKLGWWKIEHIMVEASKIKLSTCIFDWPTIIVSFGSHTHISKQANLTTYETDS